MSGALETQGTKFGIKAISGSVSVTFNATSGKIIRAAGDWTTDYKVGMLVTTSDTDNKGPFVITAATALELTVTGVLMTDAVAASFTITGYKPISEVVSFSGFDGSASEIDVTTLDSTAKEFRMGLQDFGNFSLECNHLPEDSGQVALRAAKATRAVQSFLIAYTDGSTDAFQAYVMSASKSGGVDAKVDTSFTLRITGDVTATVAA